MSEEETKVEAATEATEADNSTTKEAAPKKKGKKWPIVVGVVAVVLIAAGAGFWVWHVAAELLFPLFATRRMDPYLTTYEQEAGQPGVDNGATKLANSSSMMAVVHKDQGEDCLSCHVPTLSEQMSEGMNWVTGNYVYPLEERDTEMLTEARGIEDDAFCLNESCHNLTREDLQKATADMEFNPHVAQHGEIACSECHKAHRASVMYCTQCHSEAEVPEGWLTVAEANKLSAA